MSLIKLFLFYIFILIIILFDVNIFNLLNIAIFQGLINTYINFVKCKGISSAKYCFFFRV